MSIQLIFLCLAVCILCRFFFRCFYGFFVYCSILKAWICSVLSNIIFCVIFKKVHWPLWILEVIHAFIHGYWNIIAYISLSIQLQIKYYYIWSQHIAFTAFLFKLLFHFLFRLVFSKHWLFFQLFEVTSSLKKVFLLSIFHVGFLFIISALVNITLCLHMLFYHL